MNKTKTLLDKISKLGSQADAQMIIDYPIGRHVSWSHGRHDRGGEIIMHGYGHRVKIRSIGQREMWVSVTRIHQ